MELCLAAGELRVKRKMIMPQRRNVLRRSWHLEEFVSYMAAGGGRSEYCVHIVHDIRSVGL